MVFRKDFPELNLFLLQMFVSGFKDADFHLRKFETSPLEPETSRDFQVCRSTMSEYLFNKSFYFSAAIRALSSPGLHHPEHGQGQRQLADQVHQARRVQAGHTD